MRLMPSGHLAQMICKIASCSFAATSSIGETEHLPCKGHGRGTRRGTGTDWSSQLGDGLACRFQSSKGPVELTAVLVGEETVGHCGGGINDVCVRLDECVADVDPCGEALDLRQDLLVFVPDRRH